MQCRAVASVTELYEEYRMLHWTNIDNIIAYQIFRLHVAPLRDISEWQCWKSCATNSEGESAINRIRDHPMQCMYNSARLARPPLPCIMQWNCFILLTIGTHVIHGGPQKRSGEYNLIVVLNSERRPQTSMFSSQITEKVWILKITAYSERTVTWFLFLIWIPNK